MATIKVKGIIASVTIQDKKEFGKDTFATDKTTGDIIKDRKFQILDLEDEKSLLLKMRFSAEQQAQVQSSLKKVVEITATFSKFNGYDCFSLLELKPC